MILTLKSISREINKSLYNDEIPIHYYTELEENSQNSIVFFECISGEERKEYESLSMTDKKNFISRSAVIHIPIINVDKLYELYHVGISYEYTGTMNMLKDVVSVNSDNEKILFALFLILHEFGHWHDFKSKEKKPYLYMQDEKEQREVYDLKVQILNSQSLYGASKHKIMEQLRDYFKRYNMVSCEKRANEYAISKIKNVCDFLKKKGVVI